MSTIRTKEYVDGTPVPLATVWAWKTTTNEQEVSISEVPTPSGIFINSLPEGGSVFIEKGNIQWLEAAIFQAKIALGI